MPLLASSPSGLTWMTRAGVVDATRRAETVSIIIISMSDAGGRATTQGTKGDCSAQPSEQPSTSRCVRRLQPWLETWF